MDQVERDFWKALEYRISREFRGFADPRLRELWCDGLIPEEYDLGAVEPCVRGRAYCGGTGQQVWRFTLVTRARAGDIDWPALLPGDDVTGWLTPDPGERTLILDPLDAIPED